MTTRDIVNGIGWLFTAWAVGFTLDLIARADDVTSPQWRYLMSVPGGHWAWVTVFLCGALTLVYGLAGDRDRFVSFGYWLLTLGCGAIAAFYIAAPFIDAGLTTLGYWPWVLCASANLMLAVVHMKPRPWL